MAVININQQFMNEASNLVSNFIQEKDKQIKNLEEKIIKTEQELQRAESEYTFMCQKYNELLETNRSKKIPPVADELYHSAVRIMDFLNQNLSKNNFSTYTEPIQKESVKKEPSDKVTFEELQNEIKTLKHNQNYLSQENKQQYSTIKQLTEENKQLTQENKQLKQNHDKQYDKYLNILTKGYFIDYNVFVQLINILYANKLNSTAEKLVDIAKEQDSFLDTFTTYYK